MWFDVAKALAEIEAGTPIGFEPLCGAKDAIRANRRATSVLRIAPIARLAHGDAPTSAIQASDPDTLLALLYRDGPSTYGAAATVLGWGATRAWQAEARLRAHGRVCHDARGRAHPTDARQQT